MFKLLLPNSDIRELKAISQNLMHSSISITDGIYGNLNNDDVKATIAALNRNIDEVASLQPLIHLLTLLQSDPELVHKILAKEPGNNL